MPGDLSANSPWQAIEGNYLESLLSLGRAGGGEERRDESIQWTIGGSPIPYYNCVVRANLTESNADIVIGEVIERLRTRDVPGSWHLVPSMRPIDLPERLLRLGFTYAGEQIGMAIDLGMPPERATAPEGFVVERVSTAESLDAWVSVVGQGFTEDPREAAWVGARFAAIGLGDDVPWRHYLGTLGGEAVATSSLLLAAGSAGVYFGCTVPDARRRGIGAAIMLATLHEARALRMRVGVLASSAMGRSVWRRQGFQEHCRIGLYAWSASG